MKNLTYSEEDILIVGAGLTGLVTAYECLKKGIQKIKLVDKGRSVGGRLATRRIEGSIADHGAQFFTIRSRSFELFIKNILPDSMIIKWPIEEIHGNPTKNTVNQNPNKLAIRGGINLLAKHIGKHLEKFISIDLNVNITHFGGKFIKDEVQVNLREIGRASPAAIQLGVKSMRQILHDFLQKERGGKS